MNDTFNKPFTKEEMDAIRRAMRDESTVLDNTWRKLKRIGRRLPFAEDLLAAYFCVADPATPTRVRMMLLGALAYFVMPLDLVPDFLPLLGFTDDAALLAAALAAVASSITDAHRLKAREALEKEF